MPAASNPWRRLARDCAALGATADAATVLEAARDACGATAAWICRRRGARILPSLACRAARDAGDADADAADDDDATPDPSRSLIAGFLHSGSTGLRDAAALDDPPSLRERHAWGGAVLPLGPEDDRLLAVEFAAAPPIPGPALEELLSAYAALVARALADPTRAPAERPATAPAPSRVPRAIATWVRRVAACDLPVLVRGETGSGKEVCARAIHDLGRRAGRPFVAVNCAALAESLLDVELFGAVRGAYTGAETDRRGLLAAADGGTLFLDEVGEMSRGLQAKLLRALQERRVRAVGSHVESAVDVRVVAATHRDLARRVREGRFREDLWFRLATLEVTVPPLRERTDELPEIVDALETRLRRELGGRPIRWTDAAWARLEGARWRGNVRELHAVLARACLRADGAPLRPEHLFPEAEPPGPSDPYASERRRIEAALVASGGNVAAASRRLDWTRQRFYRRAERAGVRLPPTRRRRADARRAASRRRTAGCAGSSSSDRS